MPRPDAAKRKEYNRRYYERQGKARVTARNRANIRAKVDYVRRIKACGRCADCGGQFHPAAMDFDHVGNDKSANVSQLVIANASLDRINAEIAKCELVCSNCHRVRSWNRLDLEDTWSIHVPVA